MLFIFFGVKKTKSHLVLFVTSTILPRRQGCWGKIVPSHYRYSLQKLLSSTPCCYQRLRFTFSLLMRCFPFSANVKPIDAIRVQRRTHVSSFFNEEKRNGIFFLSHIPCCSSSKKQIKRIKYNCRQALRINLPTGQ